jgi:hypothetical protein
MAKGDSSIHPDIFNEVDNKDPNKPDSTGMDLYFGGYDEVLGRHGKMGPDAMMHGTPNSDASHDLYGGPAQGEPDPIDKTKG